MQKEALELTRVRPLVGLEVRALGVDLLAAGELALVYPTLHVGWTVLVAPRVVAAHAASHHRRRPRGRVHRALRRRRRRRRRRAADRGEAARRHRDQSRDVRGGHPDDRAPAVRPVQVQVVDVEHGAAGRRVARVRVALPGLRTRGRRQRSVVLAPLAAAVLVLLALLVLVVLLEVLAQGLLLDQERPAGHRRRRAVPGGARRARRRHRQRVQVSVQQIPVSAVVTVVAARAHFVIVQAQRISLVRCRHLGFEKEIQDYQE